MNKPLTYWLAIDTSNSDGPGGDCKTYVWVHRTRNEARNAIHIHNSSGSKMSGLHPTPIRAVAAGPGDVANLWLIVDAQEGLKTHGNECKPYDSFGYHYARTTYEGAEETARWCMRDGDTLFMIVPMVTDGRHPYLNRNTQ